AGNCQAPRLAALFVLSKARDDWHSPALVQTAAWLDPAFRSDRSTKSCSAAPNIRHRPVVHLFVFFATLALTLLLVFDRPARRTRLRRFRTSSALCCWRCEVLGRACVLR